MYNNHFITKKFYKPKILRSLNFFFHINVPSFHHKVYKHIIYYLHYGNKLFFKKIKILNNLFFLIHWYLILIIPIILILQTMGFYTYNVIYRFFFIKRFNVYLRPMNKVLYSFPENKYYIALKKSHIFYKYKNKYLLHILVYWS